MWEVYGNKEKCPSAYQYLKLGLMVRLWCLQAQASLSRIEHIKDTCDIVHLSNNGAQSANQQIKNQLMLFHDFTHKKEIYNCIKCM